MQIRFYQYSTEEFTVEIKETFGWNMVFKGDSLWGMEEVFKSKQAAIDYIKKEMKNNPAHVEIHEVQTIIVHQ